MANEEKAEKLPIWVNTLACATHAYLTLLEAHGGTDKDARAALREFMQYKGWKETDFGAVRQPMN